MQKVKLLCASGMLLLGAASPAFAQVTILNGDDATNPPNPPVGGTAAQSPNGLTATEAAPNSLIVTGPVNKGEAVPSINLDRLLSEQSGAPTTNKSGEYENPPGGGSGNVGSAVGRLLDQVWEK
jgi:hypothetical protein